MKHGTRVMYHRRFDGIVKINERIPSSSKMSRASIFLARRDRRFAAAGRVFPKPCVIRSTRRRVLCAKVATALLSPRYRTSRGRNRLKIFSGRFPPIFPLLTFTELRFRNNCQRPAAMILFMISVHRCRSRSMFIIVSDW